MKRWLNLFKQTFTEFGEDKAPRLGAALAYYTIFSIAPLLLIAIAIAGIVFGREAVQGQVVAQLRGVMGQSTAESLQEMIRNAAKPKAGTIATIIGVITLLFGASGVFQQLKDALNTIWNVEPSKKGGFMVQVRQKFLSVTMVLGVGFLLLVSLVIDTAISTVGKYASHVLPGGDAIWQTIQIAVSLAVVTFLFAMIFRYLPDTRIEWRDVWFGAGFTSILFVVGKFALGFYLGRGSIGSSYGAAGSLIVLLVWVYWSAQILFFGAEFTQVYARTHGSRIGDDSKARAAATATRVEDRAPAGTPQPNLLPVHAKSPASASKSGGGGMKLALGGIAGMFLGAIAGSIGAVILVLKTARKLITFH